MTERCDFKQGDIIEQKYHVEKRIGEGSFGTVFKVNDTSSRQTFALKLLRLWEVPSEIRKKLMERFDMEFETGQIKSNYLVRSISHGFTKENPYIVMEFCPNGNLSQFVNSKQFDITKTTKEVLYGLKDLHRHGKVHRDLKPENVLIKENGISALTDFGISGDRNKRMTERNFRGTPTQIFGTYAYMPPEQIKPDREATVLPTTDIFSFGVMMYQIITGKLPFGQLNDERDLVGYIKNGRENKWDKSGLNNHSTGKLFYPVISECLIPDFRKRLQTVDAVLSLLPLLPSLGNNDYPPPDNEPPVINGMLLRMMQGEEYGKVFKLNDLLRGKSRIITIGRQDVSADNALSIKEDQSRYISRKQCTLEWDDAARKWYIRDGQWERNATEHWKRSLNGTFVNSTEVPKDGFFISPGDIISIGDVKLRVEGY
jgi:serine/threonine protein kinase